MANKIYQVNLPTEFGVGNALSGQIEIVDNPLNYGNLLPYADLVSWTFTIDAFGVSTITLGVDGVLEVDDGSGMGTRRLPEAGDILPLRLSPDGTAISVDAGSYKAVFTGVPYGVLAFLELGTGPSVPFSNSVKIQSGGDPVLDAVSVMSSSVSPFATESGGGAGTGTRYDISMVNLNAPAGFSVSGWIETTAAATESLTVSNITDYEIVLTDTAQTPGTKTLTPASSTVYDYGMTPTTLVVSADGNYLELSSSGNQLRFEDDTEGYAYAITFLTTGYSAKVGTAMIYRSPTAPISNGAQIAAADGYTISPPPQRDPDSVDTTGLVAVITMSSDPSNSGLAPLKVEGVTPAAGTIVKVANAEYIKYGAGDFDYEVVPTTPPSGWSSGGQAAFNNLRKLRGL